MSDNHMYTDYLNKSVEGIERLFKLNTSLARAIVEKIMKLVKNIEKEYNEIKIMNFCGTHEWTVTHYGIRTIIPRSINLVAGPGCPVCVTPSYFIEEVIKLAMDGITIYTYGDTYRLRTIHSINGVKSLSEARAYGASIKIVSSLIEAINDAKLHKRDSIFVGIGFETVAPGYARAILNNLLPSNLKLLSLMKLTPPAMIYTLWVHRDNIPIRGVIAPGHVSTITGAKAWSIVSKEFAVPVIVSGFEPIDVLVSVLEILRQLSNREASTFIEYIRAVTWDGDLVAQKTIAEVFDAVDDVWRGIGTIIRSGLRLKDKYSMYDAFTEFGLRERVSDIYFRDLLPGCRCTDIVLGRTIPTQCPLFMKTCTPSTPVGPCMVSMEGTCSIWARYGCGISIDDISSQLDLSSG